MIYNFKTMEIGPELEKGRPGKKSRAQRRKCETCKNSDNVVSCSQCDLFTHLYCGMKGKVQYLLQDEETQAGWGIFFETDSTDSIWASFDPNDEKLKYDVLGFYKQCEKISQGVVEPQLDVTDNQNEEAKEEKPEKTTKRKGSKKKKSGKGSKNAKEKEKKEQEEKLKEKIAKEQNKMTVEEPLDAQALNDPTFLELYSKVLAKVSEVLARREKSSILRGGKIRLECAGHRSEDLLCICRKPYVEQVFMIRCDCCTNWFHGSCLNLLPEEAEKIEHYICSGCQDWYRYKLSNLFPSDVINTPMK